MQRSFFILRRHITPPRLLLTSKRTFSSENTRGFWQWTTQSRPHWKECKIEAAILFCVFGVTGSSTMLIIRPSLKTLGIEGSWREGPWSYRILSLLIISPIYATVLMTLGTLAGRHTFFAKMGVKIWNRFLPKSITHELVCKEAKKIKE